MSDWDIENEAFLKKIGQVKPAAPAPKPVTTTKDEE
jgi:hypothetical protein